MLCGQGSSLVAEAGQDLPGQLHAVTVGRCGQQVFMVGVPMKPATNALAGLS
jgi:hypothetical protein